jgi:CheY-like chemotaxis protein
VAYPVLVVDDEPWLTNLYAEALGSKGLEVTMVRTAADALAALGTRDFAAIVSDIRMPGMDGLRFYQAVAERFPQAIKHFGFYTAYDDEIARQFITNREVPLLRKPCRLRELEEFVLRLVHR